MDDDIVVVFGHVLYPAGVFGVEIVSADSEEQVKEITSNNPASAINKYEVHPMMAIVKES